MNTDKTYAEKIAAEYTKKETSQVIALKKLDKKAKRPATVFAFAFGIAATLVLGVGTMFLLGTIGDGKTLFLAIGGVLVALGIAGESVNYSIYKKLLEKGKMKYGSDILELARKIIEEE